MNESSIAASVSYNQYTIFARQVQEYYKHIPKYANFVAVCLHKRVYFKKRAKIRKREIGEINKITSMPDVHDQQCKDKKSLICRKSKYGSLLKKFLSIQPRQCEHVWLHRP